MKVGVDARLLSRPLTGIGRYTHEMCKSICKMDYISLYLYCPSPIHDEVLKGLETAYIKYGVWNCGISRQVWSETLLPVWAARDRVDVFWGPAHRLPRWLPSRIARVVTIHDLVWMRAGETMRPLSRLLESYQMPFAARMADAVVCDSKAVANDVKYEFNLSSDKLSIVPLAANFFTPGSFEVLHKAGVKCPYFLFVGTLEPRKNLINLLKAYAGLPREYKERVNFVIAGGEGWGRNMHQVITGLELSKYVKLVGYVDENILATLYSNARFLALPSFYEGFGLPLVEAMEYGIPVLTSNTSSMPEVVGDAGLLVDPSDIDSISDGLKKLIGDKELRKRLAARAKYRASKFDWDTSSVKIIETFKSAISYRKQRLP